MGINKMHWIGIVVGLILVGVDIFYFFLREDLNLFLFLLGVSVIVIFLPFVVGIVIENKKQREMTEMFLEFSRNLAESVATGTPISKSIINMRKKDFGVLTRHVRKLANQISLGVPVAKGLQTFSDDVGSKVVSRAVALIREAERAGGEIDFILESVAKSISEVDKLKKERRAAVYSLVVQGYIIFFIFIAIMLVMQFQIIPLADTAGGFGDITLGNLASDTSTVSSSKINAQDLARPFLYLLLVQGLLAGLTIGKLSEGSIKSGIKHSFVLVVSTFLISSGANLFFGA